MPKSGCEPVIIEDKLCLFGGFGTHTATDPLQPGSRFETDEGVYDRGNTNEFHLYNLRDVAVPFWISGQVTGDRPPPCSYYTLTLVDSRRAVMFGGNTNTGRINDVYTMTVDGTNVNFRKIKKFGPWPERRSSHAACVLNYDQEFPQLLVAGGLDNNKDPIGDLWLFSVDHRMWMKLDTELKVSDPERYLRRWRPTLSCVSRERRASVLFFGGVNNDGYKVALTTLLEFKFVENCEVPQWILEDVIPVEDNSSNTPQRVLTNPIQAVDNDEEQPYNYV